jgi:8-oxo-dGTP diphosphatase
MSSNKVPMVGVGVMILKKGKVLLGKRHDDPEKADSELHGEGTWTMPGGKLDFGEKLVDVVEREVFEETGVKIDKKKLTLISVTDDILEDVHFVTIGYLCKNFPGEPKVMEPDEITKWEWFDPKKLPSKIFPPSQKILDVYLSD